MISVTDIVNSGKMQILKADCLGSNSDSRAYLLCDLDQVAYFLCAFLPSPVKGRSRVLKQREYSVSPGLSMGDLRIGKHSLNKQPKNTNHRGKLIHASK